MKFMNGLNKKKLRGFLGSKPSRGTDVKKTQWKSTIAVHLLASGKKGCEVARHLNIREETLSVGSKKLNSMKPLKTHFILDEIIDTYRNILILSQKIILIHCKMMI